MTRPITGPYAGFRGLAMRSPELEPPPAHLSQRPALLPPGPGPAAPGQLVWGPGQAQRCTDLLATSPDLGLAAFARNEAPARGLVAILAAGQVALVLRNPKVVGLSVEAVPLPEVASRAIDRRTEFSRLGGDTPGWVLCLPMAGLSAADHRDLGILSSALRLHVQDAPQRVVMVDADGAIHTEWPADARFEHDQPPAWQGQAPAP